MDICTCLALRDDFEKFVESNNELHMYVSQNLQTDSIWLVGSFVGCGLTSHSAIFQLYSNGTVVQFPNFDLLPGTQRHGQLGVFSVLSLPQHGHRGVRRRLKPPCHQRAHTRWGYAGNRTRIFRSTVQPATLTYSMFLVALHILIYAKNCFVFTVPWSTLIFDPSLNFFADYSNIIILL